MRTPLAKLILHAGHSDIDVDSENDAVNFTANCLGLYSRVTAVHEWLPYTLWRLTPRPAALPLSIHLTLQVSTRVVEDRFRLWMDGRSLQMKSEKSIELEMRGDSVRLADPNVSGLASWQPVYVLVSKLQHAGLCLLPARLNERCADGIVWKSETAERRFCEDIAYIWYLITSQESTYNTDQL